MVDSQTPEYCSSKPLTVLYNCVIVFYTIQNNVIHIYVLCCPFKGKPVCWVLMLQKEGKYKSMDSSQRSLALRRGIWSNESARYCSFNQSYFNTRECNSNGFNSFKLIINKLLNMLKSLCFGPYSLSLLLT